MSRAHKWTEASEPGLIACAWCGANYLDGATALAGCIGRKWPDEPELVVTSVDRATRTVTLGAPEDVTDLVWHGQRLCRALDRAREAEAEAAELDASLAHCLAKAAEAAEQVTELCRLLDEARAENRELREAHGRTR